MKKALLTVSFGTSHLDTLEKNIAAIERDLVAALPDRTPRRAFTSGMIMKKLRQRDGIVIPNVDEALAQLAEEGFEDVLIQPTHVINGEEYDKLCAQARPYVERFARLRLGTPLLTDAEDYRALAQAVLPTLPVVKRVWPSDANFFLVQTDNADALYDALIAEGIIVRNRNRMPLCQGCVRITIGTPAENDRLIDVLRNLQL